jgi:putative transposase
VPNRRPVNPEIFVRLAGDVNNCRINDYGLRLDHVIYFSEEMLALTSHPEHKAGSRGHRSTAYRVMRDPNDLGRVWVHDPYRNVMIEAPACSEHYGYANGLTLYQHRKIIEHHLSKHGELRDAQDLQRAMDDYETALMDLHARRRLHGTARKIAAFVGQVSRKHARSQIVEAVTSANASAERMDPAEPLKPQPMARRSSRASPTANRPETGGDGTVETFSTGGPGFPRRNDPVAASASPQGDAESYGPEDIDFLKSKHEGYD